jgi:hypothetical protein
MTWSLAFYHLLQESNGDSSGKIWRSGFVDCQAFIGEKNTRVKELWTWEEAIQGSHETWLHNNAIIFHHLNITTITV